MTRMDFRDLIVDELGEDFAFAYFDRSLFTEKPVPTLHPWSGVAQDQWRQFGKTFLAKHGVTLGQRMAIGAWKDHRMAAE